MEPTIQNGPICLAQILECKSWMQVLREEIRVFNYCQTCVLYFASRGILSGYLSLLALHLSGTSSLRAGTRPPSCFNLDNRLVYMGAPALYAVFE